MANLNNLCLTLPSAATSGENPREASSSNYTESDSMRAEIIPPHDMLAQFEDVNICAPSKWVDAPRYGRVID